LIQIKDGPAGRRYDGAMSRPSIFSIPAGAAPAARMARRHAVARLSLAWLAMMQVMMLAWPGYVRAGASEQSLPTLDWAIVLMNHASLALAMPVVAYSAWPVWRGAWADLRRGHVGMDLPVALSIAAAFLPSLYATVAGKGPVYFDSVTMFVAFLLTARYLELCARLSSGARRWPAPLEAERQRLERDARRTASLFVAAQLALAAGAAIAWTWQAGPAQAMPVVVAMLVLSCPCALSLSVPTVMLSLHAAMGRHPGMGPDQVEALRADARRVARTSLYGSLAWHLLMVPPAFLGWVAPSLAAASMLVSSLAVAGNAWLLWRRRVEPRPVCAPALR